MPGIQLEEPTVTEIRDNTFMEEPVDQFWTSSLASRIERLQVPAVLDGEEVLTPGAIQYKAWMVPEGIPTVDGRMMLKDSLGWRDTVPLMVIDKNLPAHLQAVLVGRVSDMKREFTPEGELWITGIVTWDTDDDAIEAMRMVDDGMLASVSVDVAAHEIVVRDPDEEEPEPEDDLPEDETLKTSDDEEKVVLPPGVDMAIKRGTIVGLTQVPMPAFDDARIEAIAAGRISDPKLFKRPELASATRIQYRDGQVYGHGAAWNTCHTGMHVCTPPPKSKLSYALAAREAGPEGPAVPIYWNEGGDGRAHAPLHLSFWQAIEWYQQHSRIVGLVATGEDPYGIWVAGICGGEIENRHLSGDWRPYPTGHEHIGWSIVNSPGYPVPEPAIAASGPVAIVGAGIPCGCPEDGALVAAQLIELESEPDPAMTDLLDEVRQLRELAATQLLPQLEAIRGFMAEAMQTYRTRQLELRVNGLRN